MRAPVYTNEFIHEMEDVENDVYEAIIEWSREINQDPMIECKNLALGDTTDFEDGTTVKLEKIEINIADEVFYSSRRRAAKEISKRICNKVIKELQKKIEGKIKSSETQVNKVGDIRKIIKVLVEGDLFIILDGKRTSVITRVGIEESKVEKDTSLQRQIIGGSRACGKTTELIKLSSEKGIPILCSNRTQKKLLLGTAFAMDICIPDPISVTEDMAKLRHQRYEEVLVDEMEMVFQQLTGLRIHTASTSLELNKL